MLMPFISASLSGSFSIMSNVFSPNLLTILAASAAPIPLIAPEPRYFSIAIELFGRFVS
jgi:hypothetical protein